MSDTPSELGRPPTHFLWEVLESEDLAARVEIGDEWTLVTDANAEGVVEQLTGEGPNDISQFIVYEKHRLAATPVGKERLDEAGVSADEVAIDGPEAEVSNAVGVKLYDISDDAFEVGRRILDDDERKPEFSRFEGPPAESMTDLSLLHGFLIQGHSFFFNDDVLIGKDPTNPTMKPDAAPGVPQNNTSDRRIGIIDTGADVAHPWLSGIDATKEDNSMHGTIVTGIARQGDLRASIIVRRPNNTSDFILREWSIAASCYELIVGQRCSVINCSFGASTFGKVPLLRWVISWLRRRGHDFDVVAAAGNHHDGHDRTPIYPAAWKEVIAVAAGDGNAPESDASYYDWSNGGEWVDHIISIGGMRNGQWLLSSAPTAGTLSQYAFAVGTSVVAPLVAALADPKAGTGPNAHNLNRV